MGLFGLLNYEDYIAKTILTSSYSKNLLSIFLIYIITGIVKFHISVLLCWFITLNNFLDFIFPILVTVLLSMFSDILFKYIETHKDLTEKFVDYLINNYSKENYIKWKRFFLFVIFCYILLVISLLSVNNTLIFISTIQTLVSTLICDLLEQKYHKVVIDKIKTIQKRPKVIKSIFEYSLIEDYTPNNEPIIKKYH